ncbi:uncharacterized protein Z518_08612 [Rhinocladiella mackenziei CBS 650.93]|uniref:Uncharacterized protein n=1 Tax=Rhinocladiella mackenziei CBS 650.93 TaxID=1442369 RepID=A0A0D2J1A9_9EURO|nr:uncharacterized protein Z518_08612 [Rhinocladiella mackenziei CBS 650.93]KIX02670.1 hypothetical protein Z518_08612 [Rhinocladiella mackenziei CBS 650.93]
MHRAPMALKHQNKSLMLLRAQILQDMRPSESVIMCIWYIANQAFYSDDLETNISHHEQAVSRFVNELGGIKS